LKPFMRKKPPTMIRPMSNAMIAMLYTTSPDNRLVGLYCAGAWLVG
jgi:hypothetical protein